MASVSNSIVIGSAHEESDVPNHVDYLDEGERAIKIVLIRSDLYNEI